MNAAKFLRVLSALCLLLIISGHELGLTAVSTFAAILYFGFLPGLVIRQRTATELRLTDVLAAVLISLPISTLFFALTRELCLPAGASVWFMALPIFLSCIFPIGDRRLRWRLSRGDRWAIAAAMVAAMLLYLAMRAPGILVSWHGFFHAAVTEQVLNEGVPPTNPGMAGEALNFYWAFHIFVALITTASHANPLTVIALINAKMLALTLVIIYEVARRFLPRVRDRLLCMAAVLGAINAGAGFVLAAKYAKNGRIPGDSYSDGTWIDWLSQRAIPGRWWDGRASSLIKEYYDISGMAAGLTLFFAYAWLWISGPRRLGAWFLPLLIATLLTLTTWYPPLALPASLHAALAVFASCKSDGLRWIGGRRAKTTSALLVLVSVVIVLAYFRAITDSSGWASAGEPFISLRFEARSIIGALTPFWAIAPLVLIGGVIISRRILNPTYGHMLLLTLILFAFAAFTDVQQKTQYKYVYAMALPMGIIAVVGAAVLVRRISVLRVYPRLTALLLGLVFVHPAIVFALGAATSRQQSDRSITIEGRHIVEHTDPPRMECLAWIRDHSSSNAVLILPLVPHDRSPSNPGFRDVAIARRAALLVYDTYHSLRFRGYAIRAKWLSEIYERSEWRKAGDDLAVYGPGHITYALNREVELRTDVIGWTTLFNHVPWVVRRCDGCAHDSK